MIPRYSRPEMVALWTPERRYQTWLQVELAAGRAMAQAGLVPREAIEECAAKAGTFSAADAARIDEIEKTTRHDVIAFLTFLEERIGPAARHLHFGMTSSDVLDTSLAMLLRDAADLLLAGIDEAREAVIKRAKEHRRTPCIGRSHGIHAEPTTFGWKLAVWVDELARAKARVLRGYALSAMEDVPLWHERDISHSSVERVIGPDATVTLDFMLHRFAGLMQGLRVYPERMRENLDLTKGLIFSQPVLLKLIERGMDRQAAYVVVQRNAMKVWDEGQDFRTLLSRDPEVRKLLSPDDLDAAFDLAHELRHVDEIFDRILKRQ